VKNDEFRIIFSQQTWAGKITSSQVVINQMIVSADVKRPAETDYCTWRPNSSNLVSRVLAKEPDVEVEYTLNATDATRQSPTSIWSTSRLTMGPASPRFSACSLVMSPLQRFPWIAGSPWSARI
jgi:hypothetical protein